MSLISRIVHETNLHQYNVDTEFKTRPGFNTTGKEIKLELNAYLVRKYPDVKITQYDVIIGDGAEKPVVIRKVWASKTRKNATGPEIIFDGNKLAWSMQAFKELRLTVDLDAEDDAPKRTPKPGRPARDNSVRIRIVPTKTLDPSIIQSFLDGKVGNSNQILESINFMDHLLREGPSQNNNLVGIKRSFFARHGERQDLGGGIDVYRGIYQSMRLAQGQKLIINLDVANTTFWKPQNVLSAILVNQNVRDPGQLISRFQSGGRPFARMIQNRFKGCLCTANYPGNPLPKKEWKIHKIYEKNANQEQLDWRDPQTRQTTGEMISITQYFKRKYNQTLKFPQLPLVEMTKKGVKYPMELLQLLPNQRYAVKLDETQTANMIKFAVAPPARRKEAMEKGKALLDWQRDSFLNNYRMQIDTETLKTNARLLPPPGIEFGTGKIEQPGTKGRWDLRGKKFFAKNASQLKSWGVGFFPGRIQVDRALIEKFAQDFIKAYRGHGGDVANGMPHMMPLPGDAGPAIEQLFNQTGNKFNMRPQLLVILVQDKNSWNYLRIKKSTDCRFGVVSQVMQLAQVMKGNSQYYSNVLMKVNTKLGGCTSKVKPNAASGFKGSFSSPTMFIGADVSHASPGSQEDSMAALTVSFDRHAGRYAAGCQSNGHRVEMISETNFSTILGPMVKAWMKAVGGGNLPSQVFYMRDGVSEGQFSHVMQQEVKSLRNVFSSIAGKTWNGKLTVVVASKRHHVRAYPKPGDSTAGDQKGNPLPGALIERDITLPREFDFYLYSHIALQGTSRPVHYTILSDEADHPVNVIQNMIYEHCYQYMRSTTSVSLHPAVYYAHLASNRAKAHVNLPATAGPQGGPGFKQNAPSSDGAPSSESTPLIPMADGGHIHTSMWYI